MTEQSKSKLRVDFKAVSTAGLVFDPGLLRATQIAGTDHSMFKGQTSISKRVRAVILLASVVVLSVTAGDFGRLSGWGVYSFYGAAKTHFQADTGADPGRADGLGKTSD